MSILRAPTPQAWVATAIERWRELLVDHANCEKKAASTALALMFAYPEDHALAMALSRLAREELRHFAGFSVADELEKLERLKNSNVISNEEYARLRTRAVQ